jgi:hypothetical protein
MAVMVLITYAAILWTLRRGFGWTDESFVYTMMASSREAVGEPWGFQHLLHPLYVLTGQSVLAFRVLRLLGYVVLSLALVWAARLVARRLGVHIARSGWLFILLLAQVGTFLAWSYPPRYLGYNELASWFAQLGVALILLSLAWGASSQPEGADSRALWAIWLGLGAVTTLLVFSKVTSGVALAGLLALAVLIPNPGLRWWKRVVGAGAGAVVVLLVLWVCRYPMVFYLKNAYRLAFNKSAQRAFGHPVSGMMRTAVESVLSAGYALLPALLIFALLAVTLRWRARPDADNAGGRARDRFTWVSWALAMLLVIALTAMLWNVSQAGRPRIAIWTYLGELVIFIGAAGILGLAILAADRFRTPGSSMSRSAVVTRVCAVVVGVSAVAAAPFISAVGTNNPIAGQLLFAATLWSAVLGVALVLLARRAAVLRSGTRSVPAVIGCVVMLMAALAVKANITTPYLSASLLTQDTSTSVPALRGLLLTSTDAAWIDWVSSAGGSLGAADVPAVAMNSAGALFAFNGSGYANPWLDPRQGDFTTVRLACEHSRPADLFVLQPGTWTPDDPSVPKMANNLAACGIRFPGDFRVVAKRLSANPLRAMTIWRLKSP